MRWRVTLLESLDKYPACHSPWTQRFCSVVLQQYFSFVYLNDVAHICSHVLVLILTFPYCSVKPSTITMHSNRDVPIRSCDWESGPIMGFSKDLSRLEKIQTTDLARTETALIV